MQHESGSDGARNQPMKVVCFDFGGVLVEISRTWEEACERAGFADRIAGNPASSMLVASGHAASFQKGQIGFEEFIAGEFERLDGRFTRDQLHEIHRNWLIGEVPGVQEIIAHLNTSGVLTASLSNTDPEHWTTLREMGSIRSLGMLGLSFEMGMLKPDPGMFHAAELMFDATGSSILFFDDLQENVDSALRCGWNAVFIDPGREVAPQVRRGLESFGIGS